jgi:hypothetical protein
MKPQKRAMTHTATTKEGHYYYGYGLFDAKKLILPPTTGNLYAQSDTANTTIIVIDHI